MDSVGSSDHGVESGGMSGGRSVLFHNKLGRETVSPLGILALIKVPSRQSDQRSRSYSRTCACHHYVSLSSSHCRSSVTPENEHLMSLVLLSSWIPCVLRFYLGLVLWNHEVLFFLNFIYEIMPYHILGFHINLSLA